MMKFLSFLNQVVGVDIGSLSSHVVWRDKVVSFATAVTYKKKGKELVAVGDEAQRMWQRVPSQLEVVEPVARGRIVSDEAMVSLLDYGMKRVGVKEDWWGLGYFWAKVVGVVDPVLNSVERRVVKEVLGRLGFQRVFLIDKLMTGLIGYGWDVFEPTGKLVVYIGGEISHVSLVSLGGKVLEVSLEKGGRDVSYELIDYLRRRYGLVVSVAEVEKIKKMDKEDQGQRVRLRGFDRVKGKMQILELDMKEVDEVLLGAYSSLVRMVKQVLSRVPSEFLPEINKQGIVLMGRGSWFRGLDVWLADELGVPIRCEKDKDMIVEGLKKIIRGEVNISRFNRMKDEG